jgi:hypothetical protein
VSEELEAGPELDALIEADVMGHAGPFCPHIKATFADTPRFDSRYTHAVEDCGLPSVPPYSTDIAAAWQVVEKLKAKYPQRNDPIDDETFRIFYEGTAWPEEPWVAGFGDSDNACSAATAPLAICRAALKAVGEP